MTDERKARIAAASAAIRMYALLAAQMRAEWEAAQKEGKAAA